MLFFWIEESEEMSQQDKSSPVVVGKDGFAYADGLKIGKFVPERQTIQFVDKDRRRCAQKGREVVEVKIADLVNLPQQK